jgi:hypothetical protein
MINIKFGTCEKKRRGSRIDGDKKVNIYTHYSFVKLQQLKIYGIYLHESEKYMTSLTLSLGQTERVVFIKQVAISHAPLTVGFIPYMTYNTFVS